VTSASLFGGYACIAAAIGYVLRFVMLKPEATAWPQASGIVCGAILALGGASLFTGLQILAGRQAVTGALAAFLLMHGGYSLILAANLLRQRHITWLDLSGLFRSRETTNAAG